MRDPCLPQRFPKRLHLSNPIAGLTRLAARNAVQPYLAHFSRNRHAVAGFTPNKHASLRNTRLRLTRKLTLAVVMFLVLLAGTSAPIAAQTSAVPPVQVLTTWYKLYLELVRHTPTYSPPVASRTFGYIGVTAYEVIATANPGLATLAGQLNGFEPGPGREAGQTYDDAVMLQAALAFAAQHYFGNTGPTGQRAMTAMTGQMARQAAAGVSDDIAKRSADLGLSIAQHVFAWSQTDGGAVVENMGFPYEYPLTKGPAHWVPTSLVRQQQLPLLPKWGQNRPFVLKDGAACALPPPPDYSEDPASAFYQQALEVVTVQASLNDEQRKIARYWSDDPMLSLTPPGHWLSIALQIIKRDNVGIEQSVDVLARLGIAVADGFIGCWNAKYQYDLLRPVTYIRRVMDPKWEPLLITPPFPEYPSGHSTQSAAAATVLTAFFGDNVAFSDSTMEDDGLSNRAYPSFWAAAEEAGLSRLYGGIHFRAAIERGLDQGRCIGAAVNALKTQVK